MKTLLLAVAFAVFAVGCGVSSDAVVLEGDETLSDDSYDLSSTKDTYVIVRRDTRRCAFPNCGGYWVKDLNSTMQERYVSAYEFAPHVTTDVQGQVYNAPDFELVLLGRLGALDRRSGTRPLVVGGAWRGMPGKTFSATDKFYRVFPSRVACVRAPCAYLQTTRLNRTTGHTMATDVSVEGARAFGVDENWLLSRSIYGRTVIAGRIVRANGHVTVEASQIFVELPERTVPCMEPEVPECTDGIVAWERDSNRCLNPVGCTPPGACARLEFECEPGYSVVSWMNVCPRYACEPDFLVQSF
jgi:hypothetical protein